MDNFDRPPVPTRAWLRCPSSGCITRGVVRAGKFNLCIVGASVVELLVMRVRCCVAIAGWSVHEDHSGVSWRRVTREHPSRHGHRLAYSNDLLPTVAGDV